MLDMGEPVRIIDLSHRMIALSGVGGSEHGRDSDIDVVFTGLRPGEKLHEELLIGDNPSPTAHPRVLMADELCFDLSHMKDIISSLNAAVLRHDVGALIATLQAAVSGYQAAPTVGDWTVIQPGVAGEAPARPVPFRPLLTRL